MLSPPLRITDSIAAKDALYAATPEDDKAPSSKLETILFVDDDDALRDVMEVCLDMMGYAVIPCSTAEAASQVFLSASIDILLTDLQMPGRSGVELARDLTLLRPGLPVMILSGGIPSSELLSEVARKKWKFLGKPCRLPVLESDIKLLLGSRYRYAA